MRIHRSAFGAFATCIGFATISLALPVGSAYAALPTAAEILQSLESRETSATTLKIAWSTEVALSKEWVATQARMRGATAEPSAARDSRYEGIAKLVIDNSGRVRLAWTDVTITSDAKVFPRAVDAVFDGEVTFIYYDKSAIDRRTATIGEGKTTNLPVDTMHTLPIRLVYRPLTGSFAPAIKRDNFKVVDTATLHRTKCIVAELTKEGNAKVYFTEGDEHLPLRYVERNRKGTPIIEIDIFYEDLTAGADARPSGWEVKLLDSKGDYREITVATVTECVVGGVIDRSAFDFDIPTNAWIADFRTERPYILREDGSKRPILKGEYDGENFDELVATDPPVERPLSSFATRLLVAIAVLTACAYVVRMWLRRSIKRSSSDRKEQS